MGLFGFMLYMIRACARIEGRAPRGWVVELLSFLVTGIVLRFSRSD